MKECPPAEAWWMHQQGEGSEEERRQRQAHLVQCAACQEQWHRYGFLLHAVAEWSPTEDPPASPDCPSSETLRAYVDGRLRIAPRAATRNHLQTCPTCLSQVADLAAVRSQTSSAQRLRWPRWLRTGLAVRFPLAPGPRRIGWTWPQLGLSYAAVAILVAGLVWLLHPRISPPEITLGPSGSFPGTVSDGTDETGTPDRIWDRAQTSAANLSTGELKEQAENATTEAEKLFFSSLLLDRYEQTGQSERAAAFRTRVRKGLQ